MDNKVLATAEAYLKAWAQKDAEAIAGYLHPDVEFIGPMAQMTGRDKVVQSAKSIFGLMKSLDVRSGFASGEQAIFTYDFVCIDPIGVCRTAEWMTFTGGLISRVELFYDARPFEKLMQAQKTLQKPA